MLSVYIITSKIILFFSLPTDKNIFIPVFYSWASVEREHSLSLDPVYTVTTSTLEGTFMTFDILKQFVLILSNIFKSQSSLMTLYCSSGKYESFGH